MCIRDRADGVPAYAKLSLEELSGLPEYATIKEVVSDKLRAASVEHHIIPGEGRDWLLFKVDVYKRQLPP